MEEGDYTKQTDLDLLISMLNNHGSFVVTKIPKSEHALFMATMNEIVIKAKSSVDYDHLVRGFQAFSEQVLKPTPLVLRFFHNPLPTKKLAFDVAEDVIHSIRVRFIDGGSKSFPGTLNQKFKDAYRGSVKGGKDAKETTVGNPS
jgi:hypothetical protein